MGLEGPASNIRMVSTSCEVTKASKKRPRATEMDGSSVVAMISGPGNNASMNPAAAMPAMSCAIIVCTARCQWIFRVSSNAVVTCRYSKFSSNYKSNSRHSFIMQTLHKMFVDRGADGSATQLA